MTVDPGAAPALNLVSRTVYDAATGLETERRQPRAPNGGAASTTKTTYYSAGASPVAECAFKPEWHNLPCRIEPAAQTANPVPVRSFQYDSEYNVTRESATSGAVVRTTTSEWAKQGVVRDYEVAPEEVIVIPPGVNPDDWAAPRPRAAHDGPVKILFVGGNFERKGGLLLLEAFRQLRSLGVELHLVTRDSLPEEPGIVVYHDVQPNSLQLKQLYHSCDIFCLPTKGDCLPMVLSEAGAAGLPAVSTQIAAIPEIIRHGETGFVVPMNDPAALTNALRELVCDPQLRLHQGRQAVKAVRDGFDAQRNALRLLDVLKDVAERASATEAR